jgi:Arc/MetJ-type ribon-helix-helix transcriptional regulator
VRLTAAVEIDFEIRRQYEQSMKNMAAKIAVSIPSDLLRRVERLRRSAGKRRSTAVQEALALWADRESRESDRRRYIEGYRRCPETEAEVRRAARAGAEALAAEPWE